MRCALYARVSCKDGRQDTENQLAELRRFANSQEWTVYREYTDHETGSTGDREQFQAMLKDASKRQFDVLLFWSLDRLTREGTQATLEYLNRLSAYGVGFRSFTEAYLDSTGIWKDAIIAILATIAKQDRLRISERTKAGMARARREGKHIGRPRVVVDASRVASLRVQGHSLRAIAGELGVSVGTVFNVACGCSKSVMAGAVASL